MGLSESEIQKRQDGSDEDHSLKGALVSSSLVTIFIIVAWVAVFWLYLSRV